MNAKAVLTFTFLVLFDNYAVIGDNIVEYVKHNFQITLLFTCSLQCILQEIIEIREAFYSNKKPGKLLTYRPLGDIITEKTVSKGYDFYEH